MDRLSQGIAKLAATRLFAWHRDQAIREAPALRQTIRRLLNAGVQQSDLELILKSDQWQIQLAACMSMNLKGEQ